MNSLKKNTIISTLSLFLNSGYSAFLGFFANLVLTILLSPQIFGIYFTVLSLIAILNYFSDIGLAASLIQKEKIDKKEVSVVFTFQQILIISLVFIGFLATSPIINFYHLPSQGKYLYWSLLLSFFLSSLKTIPSIFLERKIEFQKIVFVQVVENTLFYLSVIIFAIKGLGLTSFTLAVFLRSLIGVIIIYIISPWKIEISFDFKVLKNLLRFGIPFQMSSFLALVKDDLMTLYLGKILGFGPLGYLGWAKKWAESPIRIIMDSLSRVLFPLFSRFQNNKEKLKKLIEKVIFYQTLIIAPAIVFLVILMPKLVEIIPKYNKWQPALLYFYLFSLSSFLSSFSTPFINFLNGLGKAKTSFKFMAGWTIATWILVPLLTYYFGPFGFPLTLVILSSSFVLVVLSAKKIVNFNFLKNIYPFLISSLLILFILKIDFFKNFNNLLFLITAPFLGIISYILILKIFFKINLFDELKTLWKTYQQ
ncbi:MAG: oligosaccharide flippase family protein [Patescibacteria group bacterium]|nr:oligosaccharide flippase family protein [Patescibacteria group bacterium]